MEMKIIKLLNEFENEKSNTHIVYWHYYQNGFHYLENGQTYSELLMISKKYEFIKWLVENDKIDMRKAKYYSDRIYYEDYGEGGWACKDYEYVIMLLSISDAPIEDLLLYLK